MNQVVKVGVRGSGGSLVGTAPAWAVVGCVALVLVAVVVIVKSENK